MRRGIVIGGGVVIGTALALIVAGIVMASIRQQECNMVGVWPFEVEECHNVNPYEDAGFVIMLLGVAIMIVGIVIASIGAGLPSEQSSEQEERDSPHDYYRQPQK